MSPYWLIQMFIIYIYTKIHKWYRDTLSSILERCALFKMLHNLLSHTYILLSIEDIQSFQSDFSLLMIELEWNISTICWHMFKSLWDNNFDRFFSSYMFILFHYTVSTFSGAFNHFTRLAHMAMNWVTVGVSALVGVVWNSCNIMI